MYAFLICSESTRLQACPHGTGSNRERQRQWDEATSHAGDQVGKGFVAIIAASRSIDFGSQTSRADVMRLSVEGSR